jgi:hypothetical protein
MENKDTEYKEDNEPDDFIKFLFGKTPQEKNTIKLELGMPEKNKHIGLHIFEQLIQVFVDGLKYLYGDDGKVNIQDLTEENIKLMKRYYLSIGYKLLFETFDKTNYEPKPNVFMEHDLIKEDTMLDEFYYEVLSETVDHKIPIIYRVRFKFIQ